MELSHPVRVKAATAVLALAVLYNIVPAYFKTDVTAQLAPSQVALYGQRFRALREALPARGIVGYVSGDVGGDGVWEFYQAQYFLTPVLLERGTDRELVVGNFQQPSVDAEWLANHRLTLLRDFGDGVMLFGRKTE